MTDTLSPRDRANRQRQRARENQRLAQERPEFLESCISISLLMPGDIIVTANRSFNSRAIQWATNGKFSHAMLYRGNGDVIDAVPAGGVDVIPLNFKLYESSVAAVFRHETADPSDREAAVQWASTQARKRRPYDTLSAMRVGMQPGAPSRTAALTVAAVAGSLVIYRDVQVLVSGRDEDDSFMCSELIIRAFQVAGIPIVQTAAHRTGPDKLRYSDVLKTVGHLPVGS